jgi:hypothetical protein
MGWLRLPEWWKREHPNVTLIYIQSWRDRMEEITCDARVQNGTYLWHGPLGKQRRGLGICCAVRLYETNSKASPAH